MSYEYHSNRTIQLIRVDRYRHLDIEKYPDILHVHRSKAKPFSTKIAPQCPSLYIIVHDRGEIDLNPRDLAPMHPNAHDSPTLRRT